MSKIISARKDSRVWTKCFIAENSFFGPYQGDVAQLIKTVQFLDAPSTQFKVSATDFFLLNLAACFTIFLTAGSNLEAIKINKKVFFMDLMRLFYGFNGFDFLSQCTRVKIDTSKKKIPSDLG